MLCGACNGSGEGMREGTICSICRGKGGDGLPPQEKYSLDEKQKAWIKQQLIYGYEHTISWEVVHALMELAYKKGIEDGVEDS